MKRRLVSAFLALSLVSAMFPAAAAGGSGGAAAAPVQASPPVQVTPPVQVSPPTQTNPTPPQNNSSLNSSGQTKPVTNPSSQTKPTNSTTTSSAQTNPSTSTDSAAQTAPQTLQQVNGVYQIGTAADLLAFAKLVSGGAANANATLVNDITLTGTWVPIGTTTKPYVGTFNGASRIITGLKGYLFGALGAGGKIENVLLSGKDGAVCLIKNGQIVNCTNNILPDSNAANTTTPAGNPSAGTTTTPSAGTNTSTTPSAGTNTNPPAGTTNTTTPPAGTTTTPAVTTPATAKKATVSPASASVKLGEAVTVNVSNAIPNSTILVKGPVSKTTDVGADGTTYFTIDTGTNSDKFTPSSGNSETFRFTLETGGVEIGSFALTVTNPSTPAAQPTPVTKVETAPTQSASAQAPVQSTPEPSATQQNKSSVNLLADDTSQGGGTSNKISLQNAIIDVETCVYDGTKKEPAITVTDSQGNPVRKDGNYNVFFENNVNASTKAIVEIRALDGGNYTGSWSKFFTIEQRPLSIKSVTAQDRDYDGTNVVRITDIQLNGICTQDNTEDDVSIDASGFTGNLPASDAKTYSTITFPEDTSFTLSGSGASNYKLSNPSGSVTLSKDVTINPATISIVEENTTVQGKNYDGTADVDPKDIHVEFSVPSNLPLEITDRDYTATGKYDGSSVGKHNVTVTVILSDNANCKFDDGAKNKDIIVKNVEITKTSLNIANVTAPTKVYDGTTDTKLAESNITLSDADYNFEIVSAEYKDAHVGENKEFTVKIRLKDVILSDLGLDSDVLTATLTTGKITPADLTMTWPTYSDLTLTYGQKLSELTASGAGSAAGVNGAVPGKFSWETGDELPDATDASGKKFKLIFTPDSETDKSNYNPVEQEYTVVVNKATPVVTIPESVKTLPFGLPLSHITENESVTALNPNITGTDKEKAVAGSWVWNAGADTIPTQSGAQDVQFTPTDTKNYNLPDVNTVAVTLGKVEPDITIKPADKTSCLPGTPLKVEVTAANPHSKTVQPQPAINSITYKIGNGETKPIPSNGQIPVDKDLDNNTEIVITATTNADNYYLAKTVTSTVKVTNRDAVTINAAAKGKVYDGEPCPGYENLTITDVNGSPVSAVTTTCVYKTKDGDRLDDAPIDAGEYIVEISIDTEKFVTREPITREFKITPKQLYWTSTGSRSAHKEIGAAGEATVTGTLGIGGLYERDKDRVKFTQPEMRSLNFSQCTTEGRYDILVVPATGTWADCFQLAEPYNYTLPIGNPTAVGTVGNVDASTSNELTITPATDSQGNKLKLEYTPNQVSVPESLRTNAALNTPAKIMDVMKKAVMGKNSAIINEDVFVCDVRLMVQKDGNWVEATKGNFPSGGITVTIPFPNSRAQNASYFTAAHMFTNKEFGHDPGYIEFPKASKTTSGIQFTLTGLSPVSIGWSDKQGSGSDSDKDDDKDDDQDKDDNNNSSSQEETYRVRILSTRHGRVRTSHTRAESGETVTLTIRPDSGYKLDDLIVTDNRDRDIRVRSKGNNRYTFTMPSRPVTVDVSFTDGSSSSSSTSSSTVLTPATLPVWSANYSYLNCDGITNCPSRRFPDLNTAMWYHIPLDFNINSGLMGAMGDGRFGPNETLTRAMLVQILYNHAGKPTVVASGTFRDVDRGAWYENAVNWASMQGIASGTGNNAFSPNAPITREQLSVMLYNYATRRGLTLKNGAASSFTDSWNISSWAQNAVSAMQRAGIIAGKAGGNFDPKGQATRTETAQMLYNLLR